MVLGHFLYLLPKVSWCYPFSNHGRKRALFQLQVEILAGRDKIVFESRSSSADPKWVNIAWPFCVALLSKHELACEFVHVACVATDREFPFCTDHRALALRLMEPERSPASSYHFPIDSTHALRRNRLRALSLCIYGCNEKRTLFLVHHCTCVFTADHARPLATRIVSNSRGWRPILLFWYGNDLHTLHCNLK